MPDHSPTLFDQPARALDTVHLPGEPAAASMGDYREARAAREVGIATADRNAERPWKEQALAVVRELAATRRPFTADDVWERLGTTDGTHEPAALGPVMLRASRAKWVAKTGRLVPTRHARRHRDLVEWAGTSGLA